MEEPVSLNRILQTNGAVLAAHPDLTAAVNRLAQELPGIHVGATGGSGYSGYAGQFDHRLWSIHLPTPGRVATLADRVVLGHTSALDGIMDEWPAIEAKVREQYAAAPRNIRYGQEHGQ